MSRAAFAATPAESARVLLGRGQIKEALALLGDSLLQRPDDPALWRLSGRALLEAGDTKQAELALRRAVALGPGDPSAHADLGRLLTVLGVRDEPLLCFRRAIGLDPNHIDARVRLGSALAAKGEMEEAGEHLAHALKLAPDDPGVIAGVASWLLLRGSPSDAFALCEGHPGQDPRVALIAASAAPRIGRADDALRRVSRALPAATREARIALLYARGDLLDTLDHPAEALSSFQEANALRGYTFDPEAHRRFVDAKIAAATPPRDTPPHPGCDKPVLIVGPPRTGSTLLEQALSRHPQIAAGGERETLRDLGLLARKGVPASELAARYLADLSSVDPSALRVTDKMPNNLFLLGFLSALLPGTRIIRCTRDRIDTAFSCLRQPFGPGQPWAVRWDWILAFLDDTTRLLDHEASRLPLRFLTVRYEDLALAPEETLRHVLAFLDLPYTDAVLAPEHSSRVAATASQLEVQAPIHGRSVGRAQRYSSLLGA